MASHNLRDNSCLVPCFGLHTDTVDGSLKETVMEGFIIHNPQSSIHNPRTQYPQSHYPGLQSLTEELSLHVPVGVNGRQKRLYQLQKAISSSLEIKEEDLSSLQEHYDRYKESYVKFLRFSPDLQPTLQPTFYSRLCLPTQINALLFQPQQ